MSRVAQKTSSVRLVNAKAEFGQNITSAIFFTGFLLSMYALWGSDLNRITNVSMPALAAATACFLIGGYRLGLLRR